MLRVPYDSVLVGKTLSESRIGTSTGLIILSMIRAGRSDTLPEPADRACAAATGCSCRAASTSFVNSGAGAISSSSARRPVLKSMVASKVMYAEVTITEGSPLDGALIREAAFRTRFDVAVVGLMRPGGYRLTNLAYVPLRAGDTLLVQGELRRSRTTRQVLRLRRCADVSTAEDMGEQVPG